MRTVAVASALSLLLASAAYGGRDPFDGEELGDSWTVLSTGDAEYAVADGRLHVDVPGQHWLWPMLGGNMDGPMFLVTPPVTPTVSFETRLRFTAGDLAPRGARAGLAIVRHDLNALNLLEAYRGSRPPRILGRWVDGDSGGGDGGPEAFAAGEDVWLRFEHRGDTFAFFMKEREEDDWTDITPHFTGAFPHMDFRFEAGSYDIGLFVTGGLERGDDVQVEFDYFASLELKTLGVEAAGKTAVVWAMVRRAAR